MTAFYNDFEPHAAQWLRNLVSAGHIAPGVVDGRSITELESDPNVDLRNFDQAHFFAGIGAWSHALRLLGIPDDFPIWSGSCPCQPFSAQGNKLGADDPRHLWPVWSRLISKCAPTVIVGEQVASPDGLRWFATVRSDLEAKGYAVGGVDLSAACVGAPHVRSRLWFGAVRVADTHGLTRVTQAWLHARGERRDHASRRGPFDFWKRAEWLPCGDRIRPIEPGTFPLVDGATARMATLRTFGNAIVPQVAAAFVSSLLDSISQVQSS